MKKPLRPLDEQVQLWVRWWADENLHKQYQAKSGAVRQEIDPYAPYVGETPEFAAYMEYKKGFMAFCACAPLGTPMTIDDLCAPQAAP